MPGSVYPRRTLIPDEPEEPASESEETTAAKKAFNGTWQFVRQEGRTNNNIFDDEPNEEQEEHDELTIKVTGRHWVLDRQLGNEVSRSTGI